MSTPKSFALHLNCIKSTNIYYLEQTVSKYHTHRLMLNSNILKLWRLVFNRVTRSYCLGSFPDTDSTRKVKVKVAQLCLTLCDPMDVTIHEILQARILEWVAFPFPRGSSQPRDWTRVSCVAGRFFTSRATGQYQDSTRIKIYLFTVDGCLHTFKVAYYKYIPVLVFWWTYACIPAGCVPRGGITGS